MQQSRDTGECPFCTIAAGQSEKQPVLMRVGGWVLIENLSPEVYSSMHLLAISEEHPEDNHYQSLPPEVRWGAEQMIYEICGMVKGLEEWGFSVYSRRGHNGDHTAQTIYHPHFHVVASDGKPVESSPDGPFTRKLLFASRNKIESWFYQRKPKKAARAAKSGRNSLFSTALKLLWQEINHERSVLEGKAGGIWIKISNKADGGQAPTWPKQ